MPSLFIFMALSQLLARGCTTEGVGVRAPLSSPYRQTGSWVHPTSYPMRTGGWENWSHGFRKCISWLQKIDLLVSEKYLLIQEIYLLRSENWSLRFKNYLLGSTIDLLVSENWSLRFRKLISWVQKMYLLGLENWSLRFKTYLLGSTIDLLRSENWSLSFRKCISYVQKMYLSRWNATVANLRYSKKCGKASLFGCYE
jgi:hypothetical protein